MDIASYFRKLCNGTLSKIHRCWHIEAFKKRWPVFKQSFRCFSWQNSVHISIRFPLILFMGSHRQWHRLWQRLGTQQATSNYLNTELHMPPQALMGQSCYIKEVWFTLEQCCIDGFAQECSNSIANALELLQPCDIALCHRHIQNSHNCN